MSSKLRETLKLSVIIAVAFGLGLTLAKALDLPRSATAASGVSSLVGYQDPPPVRRAGNSGGAVLPSFADVVERITPAVVFIQTGRRERASSRRQQIPPEFQDFFRRYQQQPRYSTGSGSGFIVSRDGYILTNNHVVENADQVTVRLNDNREFPARVIGRDPNTDIAVIKIDADGLPAVEFGNSEGTRIGDWVIAVGNPLGFTFTVTAGIISAKGRALQGLYDPNEAPLQIQDFIQTDAAINPGNSGGPLLDVDGRVIGINSAIASQTGFYSGYGFAIPINLARRVMSDLIRTGRVERAILGINIRDVTQEEAEYVGLDRIEGVTVSAFPEGSTSPAQSAGLLLGDVIVAVNDTAIQHTAQLQQVVGFKRPGETVRVTVVRNADGRRNVRRTFNVRLAPAEDNQVAQAAPASGDRDAGNGTSGRLGIQVEGMSPQFVARNRIADAEQGVIVTDVEEGGPAWRRLLDASSGNPDVVLSVNGTRVKTLEEFQRAMRQVQSGQVVQLRVVNLGQNGAPRVVTIRAR